MPILPQRNIFLQILDKDDNVVDARETIVKYHASCHEWVVFREFNQNGVLFTIPTIVKSTPEEQTFTITGYILSEKDMNMLIKELLEFDEISKQQMLDKVNSIIYGKTDKNIIYGEETMQND